MLLFFRSQTSKPEMIIKSESPKQISNKILIKNIPFEAKDKEVQQLFRY